MYFFLLKSVFFLVLCELLNLSKPCSCGVQSPTYLNVNLQPKHELWHVVDTNNGDGN